MFEHFTKIKSLWAVTNKATSLFDVFKQIIKLNLSPKSHFNFPLTDIIFDRFHDYSSSNMSQMTVRKRVILHASISEYFISDENSI